MLVHKQAFSIYSRAGFSDRKPLSMRELAEALLGTNSVRLDVRMDELRWPWSIRNDSADGMLIVLPVMASAAKNNFSIAEALGVLHSPQIIGWEELAIALAMPVRAVVALDSLEPELLARAFCVPIEIASARAKELECAKGPGPRRFSTGVRRAQRAG